MSIAMCVRLLYCKITDKVVQAALTPISGNAFADRRHIHSTRESNLSISRTRVMKAGQGALSTE